MISKKYRLSEREIKRVFREKKPFFSQIFIANVQKNSLTHARLGILLSSKTTPGSVNRNTFRRIFYKNSHSILGMGYDIVFVVKKGQKFSHKNPENIKIFEENVNEIFAKIIKYSPKHQ